MKLRNRNVEKLHTDDFDALIIGGGINGAATAAALAGKGAKVALIDRGDFAGSTSMHSSNLVWGGIKYMESKDFALVRKLCKSRNHLIKSYPSTVQEIRFLTTITKGFRHSPRYLWAGTWLYWLMGNGFTKLPRLLSPKKIKQEEPIIDIEGAVGGFEYSDAYLHDNDARFVFNFVRHALNYGAVAANYVESLGAEREGDTWVTKARNVMDGSIFNIRSKVLINAAGPWVDQHNALTGQKTSHQHLYSKGIHLIVPQLTDTKRVLAFFADDGRLFFVIPMGNRTCIGITDNAAIAIRIRHLIDAYVDDGGSGTRLSANIDGDLLDLADPDRDETPDLAAGCKPRDISRHLVQNALADIGAIQQPRITIHACLPFPGELAALYGDASEKATDFWFRDSRR